MDQKKHKINFGGAPRKPQDPTEYNKGYIHPRTNLYL